MTAHGFQFYHICKKLFFHLYSLFLFLPPFISPSLKKKRVEKKKQRSKGTSMIKGKTLFMNSIASIIPARIKSIRERFRVLQGERFVSSENIEIPVIAPAFPPAYGLWIIEGRKMLRIFSIVTIIRRYRIKGAIIYERGDGNRLHIRREWSILERTGDKKLARRVKKLIKSSWAGG